MLKITAYIFVLSISFNALASKQYEFNYTLNNTKLNIKRSAATYEVAYAQAAQDCFQFYKKQTRLTEEKGIEIIDVCANPKT